MASSGPSSTTWDLKRLPHRERGFKKNATTDTVLTNKKVCYKESGIQNLSRASISASVTHFPYQASGVAATITPLFD